MDSKNILQRRLAPFGKVYFIECSKKLKFFFQNAVFSYFKPKCMHSCGYFKLDVCVFSVFKMHLFDDL